MRPVAWSIAGNLGKLGLNHTGGESVTRGTISRAMYHFFLSPSREMSSENKDSHALDFKGEICCGCCLSGEFGLDSGVV